MAGNEKHFCDSRMLQCCRKFMKMLFCELFLTLAQWQTTPRLHCNGLPDRSADPTQEAGWGVRTFILITSATFSHLFLLKASGLSAESMGPSMITILVLTSYDKQHHLFPSFLDSPVIQAFIFAVPLNQALGSHIETDMAPRKADSRHNELLFF